LKIIKSEISKNNFSKKNEMIFSNIIFFKYEEKKCNFQIKKIIIVENLILTVFFSDFFFFLDFFL